MPTGFKRSHWPLFLMLSISSLFNILLPLFLVRTLTQDDVGHFKIFFLYLTIAPTFAFTSGIISGLPYWAGKQDSTQSGGLKVSGGLIVLSALFASILGLFCVGLIADQFSWTRVIAYIFAASLFPHIAHIFFEEALIATGRTITVGIYAFIFEVSRSVLMLLAAYITKRLDIVLLASFLVLMVRTFLGLAWSVKLGLFGWSGIRGMVRPVLTYALPVSFAVVVMTLANYGDQVMLSTLIPPALFAIYSFGCFSFPPAIIYEQSLTRVMIPRLSAAMSANKQEEARLIWKNAVESLGLVIIPCAFGLFTFAEPIISILFTEQYIEAASVLQIYAFVYLASIIPPDALARARGDAKWNLRMTLILSPLALAITWFGIQVGGIYGALAGIYANRAMWRLAALQDLRRSTPWGLRRSLPFRGLLRQLFMAGLLSLFALALKPLFPSSKIWMIVIGPLLPVIYFPIVFLMGYRARLSELPKKVLLLTPMLYIGGMERLILEMAIALKKSPKGWLPHVHAFDMEEKEGEKTVIPALREAGIPFSLHKKQSNISFKALISLVSVIYREGVCVIHSHDAGALMYGAAAKLVLGGHIRLVHTQHSFFDLDSKPRYRWYHRILSIFVDELTVVSESLRSTYGQIGVPLKKISVVQNGINFSLPPSPRHEDHVKARERLIARTAHDPLFHILPEWKNKIWIVNIARVHPIKGQRHALALWSHLSEESRKAAVLLFIGPASFPGGLEDLRAEAEVCPTPEHILVPGGTTSPETWLAAADVFISCSEFEGLPLSPLEAMGQGIPVILSDIPGHRAFNMPLRFYPLSDPKVGARLVDELVQKIASGDPGLYHDSEELAARVRGDFSLATMMDAYIERYASNVHK